MSRIKARNLALQDCILEVLADAWPDALSSSEIAERVGGKKTIWEICGLSSGSQCHADPDHGLDPDLNPTHHPGPVPQDSWECDWWASDMNPPLNRLAREGLLQKIQVRALRGVLWRWAGDTHERDSLVAHLESLLGDSASTIRSTRKRQ